MVNYLVFGGREINYARKDGSEVNHKYLYHFPLEFLNSSVVKGSELLVLDLHGSDFSLDDFEYPSVVKLSKKSLPAERRGAPPISRLVDVELVRSLELPGEGYLIMGIKSFLVDYSQLPPSYKTNKRGSQRALKIFGIDLDAFNYGSYLGYLPFDASYLGSSNPFNSFSQLPSTYSIEFDDRRGAGGENLSIIKSLSLLSVFDGLKDNIKYLSSVV